MYGRKILFAGICFASVVLVAIYVYQANQRLTRATPVGPSAKLAIQPAQETSLAHVRTTAPPEKPPPAAKQVETTRPEFRILFRHNAVDNNYGRVAVVKGDKSEFAGSLRCDVLHVSGGRGICLTADRGIVTTYAAELFASNTFERIGLIPLKGVPSRCRMSRNGRLAALTVFVSGHSYASMNFSTQTLIVDATSGQVLADVETFAVTRNGAPFRNVDFNFWGVTFTPKGDEFYCTLSSQSKHYLVKADIATRTATVIYENVECPSLSPDAKRIAYKKRVPSTAGALWQLYVLDLASGHDTPLAETRSVDDQLEWLDDEHVLYALPLNEISPGASTNVWVASADGKEHPRTFLTHAYSPAVER